MTTNDWPKGPLTEEACDALEARGIPPELATACGVVSIKSRKSGDSRVWIGFRHLVDGENDHWAFRTITGNKQFYQSTGTQRRFWNNQVITDPSLYQAKLVVTEGQCDALVVMAAGYRRTVSIPDGAIAKEGDGGQDKFSFLENQPGLESVKEIVLMMDGDGPGRATAEALVTRLGRGRCRWVQYPKGCKDPTDIVMNIGQEALVETIESSRWYELDGLYNWDELPLEPDPQVFEFGIGGLDPMWKVELGRMGVLVGIPGHGKSTLITNLICTMAQRYDWVIAIASLEDKQRRNLGRRLLKWKLQADPQYVSAERYAEAEDWVRRHFVFIKPGDDGNSSVSWYLERCGAAVSRRNVSMCVLDPWNDLDHSVRPGDVAVTEYVGVTLRKVRRHAVKHNYYSLVAVHPPKMNNGKDGGTRMPTGYDCADSAHWVNKTDHGITIFREPEATTICVWKSKDHEFLGVPGEMTFKFDAGVQRYFAAPELMKSEETR